MRCPYNFFFCREASPPVLRPFTVKMMMMVLDGGTGGGGQRFLTMRVKWEVNTREREKEEETI